jgi:hypothetical protein
MEDFIYNGSTIKFSVESGRVLPGQQKVTKTTVRSSGGGGYVHQGSGFVDAPKITSTTTTEQEFWLQAESGHQVPVRIAGDVMAVNVDQEVSLLHAQHPTKGGQWLVGIVNHSARKTAWLLAPGDVVKGAGLVRWWPYVLAALLSLVPLNVLSVAPLGFISAGAILYLRFRKQRAVAVSLGQHLWHLEQSLMARPPLSITAKSQS